MGVLGDNGAFVVFAFDESALNKRLFIGPGGGGCQVEHPGHRRTLGALVFFASARDVVRRDAPLLVGGPRQGNHRAALIDKVLHLNGVAHGVDIGIGGAQEFVGHNAAASVHGKTGGLGQLSVGPHAYGEDHEFGFQCLAALEGDLHAAALVGKVGNAVAQIQLHAVSCDVLVQELGHLEIQRCHHLVEHFHDGNIQPRVAEVFRHLEPDEAAADHRRRPDLLFHDERADAVGVGHRPEGLDPGRIDSGDRGTQRRGAGGNNQGIIAFFIVYVCAFIQDGDGLFRAVDRGNFVFYPYVHVEFGAHHLGRLQDERVP
ncbi:hypothetical protein SDC9_78946 [bioreactor metagenome]|uniref:Uncharacterized protein n=1 Tax=bioreactor metagenome TaxID=1076179 RepID=A0A644Z2J7_9ZZZZ